MKKWLGMMLLLCCLFWSAAAAEELVGTWGFAGGAEVHGDGFRLNADGTGVWLEATDYDTFPLRAFIETDSTFTWKTVTEDKLQYLVETYPDGREEKIWVHFYEDGRLHLPEGEGGGFYWPAGNDAALRTYLEGRMQMNSYDRLLEDYLQGELAENLAALGLRLDEACVMQIDYVVDWKLLCLCWQESAGRSVRIQVDLYTHVAEDGGLWNADADGVWQVYTDEEPCADAALHYAEIAEGLRLLDEKAAQPTPALVAEIDPLEKIAQLQADLRDFPQNKTYNVYQGPGEAYGRSGGGKGKVSTNGDIFCYGTWNGWLLIEYEISGDKYRYGWIDAADLPSDLAESFAELDFAYDGWEYTCGVVVQDVDLTDDPFHSKSVVADMDKGASVHVLAKKQDYFLVEGYVGRKLCMGFVPAGAVDLHHGYAEDVIFTIDEATSFTLEEIYAAMEAVNEAVRAWFPGVSVVEIKYIEAESADADDWWQPEEAGREGMQLFADLNGMGFTDFEIGSYGMAMDFGFILYRDLGGAWQVSNWGYE